ncbi:TetR/AcrR family transcriptional regulator [Saccharothrix longispora]|uniref:AcrR family transcriptional regulator n=1 Tax=Saccharothrix longispora TaxID=33920 RepID=A0ABU1PN25_9PSEU|nr:TetR/AcrR family transcriptional regulator [Saccharothrix longispora]MDR6591971.1 AcrR family transcriptional regulator [Saccharothrix longispora]
MTGTPRQRARAQAIEDIKRIARDQVAREGGAALSLRAIARELGIVSSAVYRYVPSRDELLTMLIVDAYNSLGDAVEAAEARVDRADRRGRWTAIGTAVREWAVARPAEYALLYGSPVPGYEAPPERTGAPGTRVSMLLLALVEETSGHAGRSKTIPGPLGADFAHLRHDLDLTASDDLLARAFLAWSSLFGLIGFELFGQFNGSITAPAAHFEHQLGRLADLLQL